MIFAVTEKGERAMTCKDCIHYNICSLWCSTLERDESYNYCNNFKSTDDYVAVKHGYWITLYQSDRGNSIYQCSNCQRLEFRASEYCPNCGAKMDGESK